MTRAKSACLSSEHGGAEQPKNGTKTLLHSTKYVNLVGITGLTEGACIDPEFDLRRRTLL